MGRGGTVVFFAAKSGFMVVGEMVVFPVLLDVDSESLITWAAITLMTRHITRRSSRRSRQPASREATRD
ncbi:hypothetical protein [Streptomyces sp. SLBN-31]|uniref:hypothetical protein n=1 Tax=Streptomyces sp. SLBN-31 TaxID=2768444 RepID=UPI001154EC78|nr:hypothetical protein [Streptomyces sp. SLBN-31]TQJ92989.1 hypothetical protein FBY22_3941 [Streptomyces sp. SLBN-31]